MTRLRLSLAISDYDHVRDLVEGRVRPEAIELVCSTLPVEEIFYRFLNFGDWDVAELSLAKYVARTAAGTADFVALPVFPSRMFRISSIYVRADSPLERPEDLAGKRIGLPEWAQTAAVYTRGWLAETVGVDLATIEWIQAGVNQPGRSEKVALNLPLGLRLRPEPRRTLSEMLIEGALDAVFSAHPPAPFEQGTGLLRPLLAKHRQVEESYHAATGIFPIMHVVAVKRAVLDAHPWVGPNLMSAFAAARTASLARLFELTASRFPLPWAAALASEAQQRFGELFPYGLEANRATLEAFLRFAQAQGLTERVLEPEELFARNVLDSFRI